MDKEIIEVFEDLNNFELPKDENAYNKIKCSLTNGQRVYWYYKDDLEFCKEIGEDARRSYLYSGIVFTRPFIEKPNYESEMNIEDCIVCIDWYPCEKCYPETDWIALNRLIDNDDLVEIYTKD